MSKPNPQVEFDFLGELQNSFVKIPLLQAMRDVPIYAKNLKDYCSKKPGRKPKDPLTIHVVGRLSDIMLRKIHACKIRRPWEPDSNSTD